MEFEEFFSDEKSIINESYLPNFSDSIVNNISHMFYECRALISLPDISKWNTSNVRDMSYMFYECTSLLSLPDISNWNTSNAQNMSHMFCGCKSLLSLPDISKWNTSNVLDMSYMFYECYSLISLPNISKWYIFYNDEIVSHGENNSSFMNDKSLSTWSNPININNEFNDNNTLIPLTIISERNINSINSKSDIYNGCNTLKSIPEIIKENNFSDISKSLNKILDIQEWIFKKTDIFKRCSSLTLSIDLSKFNRSKKINIKNIFDDCFNSLNNSFKFGD